MRENAQKAQAGDIDKVRLPKGGNLNNDKKLVAEAEKLISALCKRDGTTFKTLVITSNDWTTAKHKNTGLPLYRWVTGYMVDYKAGRGQSDCKVFSFNLKQDYDGVGNFAGDYKLDCCGQDLKVGLLMNCNNAK